MNDRARLSAAQRQRVSSVLVAVSHLLRSFDNEVTSDFDRVTLVEAAALNIVGHALGLVLSAGGCAKSVQERAVAASAVSVAIDRILHDDSSNPEAEADKVREVTREQHSAVHLNLFGGPGDCEDHYTAAQLERWGRFVRQLRHGDT